VEAREELLLLVLVAWLAELAFLLLPAFGPVFFLMATVLAFAEFRRWGRSQEPEVFEPGMITALPRGRIAGMLLFPLWTLTLGLSWWMMTLPDDVLFRMGAFYFMGLLAAGASLGVEFVAREERIWFEHFLRTPRTAEEAIDILSPGILMGMFYSLILSMKTFLREIFQVVPRELSRVAILAVPVWVAPVAEEMIFAGTLLPTLLDKVDDVLRFATGREMRGPTIILSVTLDGIAFSLMHIVAYKLDIKGLIVAFTFRALVDILVIRTRSFLTGVAAHVHANLTQLIINTLWS